MAYRHPPPILHYNEQYSNQSRPPHNTSNFHPNFSSPPPPIIPRHSRPPPQSQHSMYNPNPHFPSWGSNLAVGNNVPFHSQVDVDMHTQQGYASVKGTIINAQTTHPNPFVVQLDERASDEEWIRQYTLKLAKPKCIPILNKCEQQSSTLKIFEGRQCLEECQNLIKDLQCLEKDLIETVERSSIKEWQESCNIIETKKARLLENLHKLSESRTILHLQEALSKRRKKREALKRRRSREKERKAACLKRRQQLHLSIDTWLEEMQQSVEKVKQEESLKHQADIVLSDVTRKTAEARRQLTLMSMLLKLRRVRVQAAANRGEHTSIELANIFENVVEKLQNFWSDQLKGYNLEEKGLQVMLEEATEDTSKKKKSLHQRILSEWQGVIFGKNPCANQFYTVAESNMEAFIAIRRDWDKFVIPSEANALMASSLPIGWVLPPSRPSSEQWEELQQANQSNY